MFKAGERVNVNGLLQAMIPEKGIAHIKPFPEMISAIRSIKAEGIKTALLTNNWRLDGEDVKSHNPLSSSLFDVVSGLFDTLSI